MPPIFTTPMLVCRPALPKDTEEVLSLTRYIWGGEDYIPYVWNDWLADPEGLLAVAEYDGKVAGLGKLTHLRRDEWWMEGLRVHPRLQGRGIASHMHAYLLDTWQRYWGGVIRLVTSSKRLPVHRMCERTGFVRTGEFSHYFAVSIPEETVAFRPLLYNEIPLALQFAQQSSSLAYGGGMIDLGWQWATLSASHMEEAVENQMAWLWQTFLPSPMRQSPANPTGSSLIQDTQGLLLLRKDDEDEKITYIAVVACPLELLAPMLMDSRRLVSQLDTEKIAWMPPLHPDLIQALETAGFQKDWEESLFLFVKQHESMPRNPRFPPNMV